MVPEPALADILPFKRPQRPRPIATARNTGGTFGPPTRPVPDALFRGQRHEPVTSPPELVLLDNDDTDKLIDGILTTIRDAMDTRGLQDHTDDILDAVAEHIANHYFGYTS